MWTGAQWTAGNDLNNNIGSVVTGVTSFGLGWVGTTQKAVVVFDDGTNTGSLHWGTYTDLTSWTEETDLSISGIGEIRSAVSTHFSESDRVMFIVEDNNADIYGLIYDNSDWEVTNNGSPLESNLTSDNTKAYSLTTRPKPIVLVSDHKNLQLNDNFSENGQESAASLYAFQLKVQKGEAQTISQMVFNLSESMD